MAQSSAMQTYQAVGNREDLYDVLTRISPEETPMLSTFGHEDADNTYVEWLTEELASPTANAKIEGADYTFARRSTRTRTGGYTQIFETSVEVSDTQRAVNAAGIEDEYSHQVELALMEHATDVEYAIVNGTGASGASGTARELKGILAWVTTNISSATASRTLTESMYNDSLQQAWDKGGKPRATYVAGNLKRQISSFTGGATKELPATENQKVFNTVAVYQSDFGTIVIKLDRFMESATVLNIQEDMFKIPVLRPTKNFEIAKVGSATRGVVETELGFKSRQEKASSKITQVVKA